MSRIGKGLSGTQVKSTNGTPASGVVNQSGRSMSRGARLDPVSHAQLPGKGKRNTETRNSPGVQKQFGRR
jgi:hypothetical protein